MSSSVPAPLPPRTDVEPLSYRRHFLAPLVVILIVASSAVLAVLIWLTVANDRGQWQREQQLAGTAIRTRIEFVRKNIGDYAFWDEAVTKLVIHYDAGWMDETMGPYLYSLQGYRHTFVIDGHNHCLYANDGPMHARIDPFKLLGGSFARSIAELRVRPAGSKQRIAGLTMIGGNPAIFAVAGVVPDPGRVKLPPGPETYLVFVDVLDPPTMRKLGGDYGLRGFRTVQPGDRGGLQLKDVTGRALARLSWDGDRPGTRMRRLALPVVGSLMFALIVIAALVLRKGRSAIKMAQLAFERAESDAERAHAALDELLSARQALERAAAAAQDELQKRIGEVQAENGWLNAAAEQTRREAMLGTAAALRGNLGPVLDEMHVAVSLLSSSADALRGRTSAMLQRTASAASFAESVDVDSARLAEVAEALALSMRNIATEARLTESRVDDAAQRGEFARLSVEDLSLRLDQIDGVLSEIKAISARTKLLALNATIEAARAGVAGRGFAVVAGEVKNLAQQTDALTRRVDEGIAAIRGASSTVTDAIQHVDGALVAAGSASSEIARAADQRAQGSADISREMIKMAAGSRTAADAVAEVARAVDEGGQAADDIAACSGRLDSRVALLDQEFSRTLQMLEEYGLERQAKEAMRSRFSYASSTVGDSVPSIPKGQMQARPRSIRS